MDFPVGTLGNAFDFGSIGLSGDEVAQAPSGSRYGKDLTNFLIVFPKDLGQSHGFRLSRVNEHGRDSA
jgi:hypothetical protein